MVHIGRSLAAIACILLLSPQDVSARGDPLGEPCSSNVDCASGVCDGIQGRPHKCVPPQLSGKLGDFCQGREQCQGTCRDAQCVAPQVNGEGCMGNHECASNRCGAWRPGTLACIPNDGTARVGDACSHNNHCQNGNCVSFQCAAKKAVGAECTDGVNCTSGRCDSSERRCVANDGLGNLGDFCTSNNQCRNRSCISLHCANPPRNAPLGVACASDPNCQSGRCDFANGPEGQRCIPKDGTGQAFAYCSHNHHCKSGSCAANKCRPEGAAPSPLGSACGNHTDCDSGFCDLSPYASEHRCVPPPNSGGVGDFCTLASQCRASCRDSKCAAPQANGVGCWTNHECASNRCGPWRPGTTACIPNDGTAEVGDACSHNNHCQNRNCIDFKCAAPVGLGQECETNASCRSGRCDGAPGNPHKCIPNDGTGALGAYCTHNNQCANRNCISGSCRAPVALGKYCSTNASCTSGRCDAAPGNPHKCIPNDGAGRSGDYCTHNNHCRPGLACELEPGKRYGSCGS